MARYSSASRMRQLSLRGPNHSAGKVSYPDDFQKSQKIKRLRKTGPLATMAAGTPRALLTGCRPPEHPAREPVMLLRDSARRQPSADDSHSLPALTRTFGGAILPLGNGILLSRRGRRARDKERGATARGQASSHGERDGGVEARSLRGSACRGRWQTPPPPGRGVATACGVCPRFDRVQAQVVLRARQRRRPEGWVTTYPTFIEPGCPVQELKGTSERRMSRGDATAQSLFIMAISRRES
jgi:hypothetical protein